MDRSPCQGILSPQGNHSQRSPYRRSVVKPFTSHLRFHVKHRRRLAGVRARPCGRVRACVRGGARAGCASARGGGAPQRGGKAGKPRSGVCVCGGAVWLGPPCVAVSSSFTVAAVGVRPAGEVLGCQKGQAVDQVGIEPTFHGVARAPLTTIETITGPSIPSGSTWSVCPLPLLSRLAPRGYGSLAFPG